MYKNDVSADADATYRDRPRCRFVQNRRAGCRDSRAEFVPLTVDARGLPSVVRWPNQWISHLAGARLNRVFRQTYLTFAVARCLIQALMLSAAKESPARSEE